MCGRFALHFISGPMREFLGLPWLSVDPRYNIAPGQNVLAIVSDPELRLPAGMTGRAGPSVAAQELSWGLVPSWARDAAVGMRSINARSETAAEKPAFKAGLKYRRCLVPATGFYEWKRIGRQRVPYFFTNADRDDGLALGGVWEDWSGGGRHLRSFAILTTAANDVTAEVHDRLPVLVRRRDWQRWLDPATTRPDEVADIMQPCRSDELRFHRVADIVNKPGNDSPVCIAPFEPVGPDGSGNDGGLFDRRGWD